MNRIENYFTKAQSKEESILKEWLSGPLPKRPTNRPVGRPRKTLYARPETTPAATPPPAFLNVLFIITPVYFMFYFHWPYMYTGNNGNNNLLSFPYKQMPFQSHGFFQNTTTMLHATRVVEWMSYFANYDLC